MRALPVAAALLVAIGCAEGTEPVGGSGGSGAGPTTGGADPEGGRAPEGGEPGVGAGTTDGGAPPTVGGNGGEGGEGGGEGGAPATCGNSAIDGTEDCDGTLLGGATCQSIGQGFIGGDLECEADCTFNTTGCEAPGNCGNNTIDVGEDCDGALLGGGSCVGEGHSGGMIGCTAGCLYDTSNCFDCGDGAIDSPEVCDGTNFGTATCLSLGHDGGTLSCAGNCLSVNQTACSDCGDNTVEAPETCDGTNLNGQTCQLQGFSGGTLQCNSTCNGYNTSGCTSCTTTNLFAVNGGFDNGLNGGQWTEASSNFGTPVCSVALCGNANGTGGPHQGAFWAWFGGTNSAAETATVTRTVLINPGMATLRFQFDLPGCEDPIWATDIFRVTVDGQNIFQRTNSDPGCGVVGYEQITLDLSAYANGQTHTIQFFGSTDDFFAVTNFMLDTVELMACQ